MSCLASVEATSSREDPASVAHLSTLGPAAYVIVTNFDYWWHDVREYFDPTGGHLGLPRRVAAQRILNASLNAGLALTPELMNATISADGVLADTIFQAVADVEVGRSAVGDRAAGAAVKLPVLITACRTSIWRCSNN